MRRAALLLVLLAAGCGASTTGEGGACAAALVRDGMLYSGTGIDAGRGVRSAELIDEGFEIPGCNDGGGFERDRPTTVFAVRGVSPELAVIDDGSLYLNTGYLTELRDHPLHDLVHGGPDRPRIRPRGSRCTIDGRVLETFFGVAMQTERRRVAVAVDVRTRIDGFDRAGLPYLEKGDELRVRGRCRGESMLARRIMPAA